MYKADLLMEYLSFIFLAADNFLKYEANWYMYVYYSVFYKVRKANHNQTTNIHVINIRNAFQNNLLQLLVAILKPT